jgi:hypothetical protein
MLNTNKSWPELWSKEGAEKLAKIIEAYWLAKGHTVKTWVEKVPRRQEVFQVRSDLINGAPSAKS